MEVKKELDDFQAQERLAEISLNDEHYQKCLENVDEQIYNFTLYSNLIRREMEGLDIDHKIQLEIMSKIEELIKHHKINQ